MKLLNNRVFNLFYRCLDVVYDGDGVTSKIEKWLQVWNGAKSRENMILKATTLGLSDSGDYVGDEDWTKFYCGNYDTYDTENRLMMNTKFLRMESLLEICETWKHQHCPRHRTWFTIYTLCQILELHKHHPVGETLPPSLLSSTNFRL